jgi:hypothetical protein
VTAFFADLADQVPDYEPGAFNACFPQPNRGGRPLKQQPIFFAGAQPDSVTAGGNSQHLSEAEQWLADLERLDEVEFKNACFFDAMAGLAVSRGTAK